jgi:hypothetical protein
LTGGEAHHLARPAAVNGPKDSFRTHTGSHRSGDRSRGDIFVERGLIDEEQLREALLRQCETGDKLGEVLVELGFVDRIALAGVITEQWEDRRATGDAGKAAPPEPERDPFRDLQVDVLKQALAERDRRIAQQEATIAALLAQIAAAA